MKNIYKKLLIILISALFLINDGGLKIEGQQNINLRNKKSLDYLYGTKLKSNNPSQIKPVSKSTVKVKNIPNILQSNIEQMFNRRYNDTLKSPLMQYGYNFFKRIVKDKYLPVGDKYIVGPGDTIAIYFWGSPVDILKLKGFHTLTVDRTGKIFIPKLGVFYVWGLSASKIKSIIYKAMSRKYRKFEVEVTLGKIREFPVYVSGFVKQPGIIMATGVSNVLDVLVLAGGVEKNGSLRSITLKRNENGITKTINVDLYGLLIKGKPINIIVKEGDSIFVNSISKIAGITGGVKRPAIYELSKGITTIKELIATSGGILPSAHSIGVKLFRYQNNSLQIREGKLKDSSFVNTILLDGDFLAIENLYNIIENEIIVRGHVAYPGKYSYTKGKKLSDIISKVGILPDTNLFSAGFRRDRTNKVFNFSPKDVLNGKVDFQLEKMDIVNFYPKWIHEPIQVMGEIKNPGMIPFHEDITLLDVLQDVKYKSNARLLKAEIFSKSKTKPITVYLNDLLFKALKNKNIKLIPGSKILIKFTEENEKRNSLTLLGEVKKPGIYKFKKSMTLYDILKKAGGYTENAYPRGLIFIRRSAMRLQEEQIKISFLSMQQYLANQTGSVSNVGSSPEERTMLKITLSRYKHMLDILKKKSELTMGRMALEIPSNLEDLKKSPENIILTDLDYIYIPHKPNYILVLGDVYNQMSLPYDSGKTVKYYLNQLGGMGQNADESNMYIIRANGKIISKRQFSSIFEKYYSVDWKNMKLYFAQDFGSIKLEQGDTVVVPSELKVPIMWRPILRDITQIAFQAMSTVFLATKL
ncbi:SLBB domain-containing protein [Spirochaetota bacterium]